MWAKLAMVTVESKNTLGLDLLLRRKQPVVVAALDMRAVVGGVAPPVDTIAPIAGPYLVSQCSYKQKLRAVGQAWMCQMVLQKDIHGCSSA